MDEDLASDGTFENARTYVQNWRHDVVAMLSSSGTVNVASKQDYTSYGEPPEIWAADISKDGVVDIVDFGALGSSYNKSVGDAGYDARADFNADGTVDIVDFGVYGSESSAGGFKGTGSLNSAASGRGYAGYTADPVLDGVYHVRNRVYLSKQGRWSRRDPIGYIPDNSLYRYVNSNPTTLVDPSGLGPPEEDLPFVTPDGTIRDRPHWARPPATHSVRGITPARIEQILRDACIKRRYTALAEVFSDDSIVQMADDRLLSLHDAAFVLAHPKAFEAFVAAAMSGLAESTLAEAARGVTIVSRAEILAGKLVLDAQGSIERSRLYARLTSPSEASFLGNRARFGVAADVLFAMYAASQAEGWDRAYELGNAGVSSATAVIVGAAVSGALAGSVAPGVGTAIGFGAGLIAGALQSVMLDQGRARIMFAIEHAAFMNALETEINIWEQARLDRLDFLANQHPELVESVLGDSRCGACAASRGCNACEIK